MKLTDLKDGDFILCDNGFTCLEQGRHTVKSDEQGDLYIDCAMGYHYLDGQENEDGDLIGIAQWEGQ